MSRLTLNAEMDSEYKYIVKGKLGLLIWGAKFRDKKQADDYIDRMNEEASPHAIDWEIEDWGGRK